MAARRLEIVRRFSPNNHTNVHKKELLSQRSCTEVHQKFFIGYSCINAGVNDLMQIGDIAFHFETPEQRLKVVNFDVCNKKTKLIAYHSNVP